MCPDQSVVTVTEMAGQILAGMPAVNAVEAKTSHRCTGHTMKAALLWRERYAILLSSQFAGPT
jgi:hypothetical protein